MAPRRATPLLAAPFALLTALVAACGSHAPGVFHPAGASVAADSPAPATPGGLAPFPGKLTFDFDPLPASPRQAAVAIADRDFVLAYYYAVYKRGKSQAYASYIGDKSVLLNVQANIEQQVAEHRGYSGLAKYSDTTVQALPGYGGEQQVSYCVDESQLKHTDIRTGQVVPKHAPADHQYYRESDMLAKSRHGAWQVVGTLVTYYPQAQAQECK